MNPRVRRAAIRLASVWGGFLLAFLIGYAAHSIKVFMAVLAIDLVVHIALRFTIWR